MRQNLLLFIVVVYHTKVEKEKESWGDAEEELIKTSKKSCELCVSNRSCVSAVIRLRPARKHGGGEERDVGYHYSNRGDDPP